MKLDEVKMVQEKTCSSTLKINYRGEVSVQIKEKKANKVLATYTNHNKGNDPLFTFLALCLAGEYSTADATRPFKIKLFYNDELPNNGEKTTPVTAEVKAASSFISMNTAPDVHGNSVTYHFTVPYSYIISDKVNQICLYGADEKNLENYSAYFYILNKDDKGEGIVVTRALSNLSLMID